MSNEPRSYQEYQSSNVMIPAFEVAGVDKFSNRSETAARLNALGSLSAKGKLGSSEKGAYTGAHSNHTNNTNANNTNNSSNMFAPGFPVHGQTTMTDANISNNNNNSNYTNIPTSSTTGITTTSTGMAGGVAVSTPTTAGASTPALNSQFKMTRLCPDGPDCPNLESCNFAHRREDLRPSVDLSRTKLCAMHENKGHCSKEKCSFAHGHVELRSTLPYFKTIKCSKYFDSNPVGVNTLTIEGSSTIGCSAGLCCRHAHFSGEIPMWANLVQRGVITDQVIDHIDYENVLMNHAPDILDRYYHMNPNQHDIKHRRFADACLKPIMYANNPHGRPSCSSMPSAQDGDMPWNLSHSSSTIDTTTGHGSANQSNANNNSNFGMSNNYSYNYNNKNIKRSSQSNLLSSTSNIDNSHSTRNPMIMSHYNSGLYNNNNNSANTSNNGLYSNPYHHGQLDNGVKRRRSSIHSKGAMHSSVNSRRNSVNYSGWSNNNFNRSSIEYMTFPSDAGFDMDDYDHEASGFNGYFDPDYRRGDSMELLDNCARIGSFNVSHQQHLADTQQFDHYMHMGSMNNNNSNNNSSNTKSTNQLSFARNNAGKQSVDFQGMSAYNNSSTNNTANNPTGFQYSKNVSISIPTYHHTSSVLNGNDVNVHTNNTNNNTNNNNSFTNSPVINITSSSNNNIGGTNNNSNKNNAFGLDNMDLHPHMNTGAHHTPPHPHSVQSQRYANAMGSADLEHVGLMYNNNNSSSSNNTMYNANIQAYNNTSNNTSNGGVTATINVGGASANTGAHNAGVYTPTGAHNAGVYTPTGAHNAGVYTPTTPSPVEVIDIGRDEGGPSTSSIDNNNINNNNVNNSINHINNNNYYSNNDPLASNTSNNGFILTVGSKSPFSSGSTRGSPSYVEQ